MSAPIANQMLVGIFDAPERRLDQMVALVWRGHAEGHLCDVDASHLAEAAKLRRSVFAARRAERSPRGRIAASGFAGPRNISRGRQRTWSASGAMPPHLRCHFTPGENAVAAVIRAEVRQHGCCSLANSTMAKCAGLRSTTVVKRFLREACKRGLIHVKQRPVRGDRHKPNVITIISRDWQAWNAMSTRKGGGGTDVPSYQNNSKYRPQRRGKDAKQATPDASGDAERGLGNRKRWRCRAKPGPGGRGNG